jgi:hypothetical protein
MMRSAHSLHAIQTDRGADFLRFSLKKAVVRRRRATYRGKGSSWSARPRPARRPIREWRCFYALTNFGRRRGVGDGFTGDGLREMLPPGSPDHERPAVRLRRGAADAAGDASPRRSLRAGRAAARCDDRTLSGRVWSADGAFLRERRATVAILIQGLTPPFAPFLLLAAARRV